MKQSDIQPQDHPGDQPGNQSAMQAEKQPMNPDGNQDKSEGNAVIGISMKIEGNISGKEDLVIHGSVEGTIDFRENDVLVGEKGRVTANVVAKNIRVEGEVKGELRGGEEITIKPTGRVVGDIRAPRVILKDGCQFKGSVDMDEKPAAGIEARGVAAKLPGTKPFGHTATDRIIPRKV